ncbi:hypothetical protein GCM10020216_047210 [Nonomuraea helvata]
MVQAVEHGDENRLGGQNHGDAERHIPRMRDLALQLFQQYVIPWLFVPGIEFSLRMGDQLERGHVDRGIQNRGCQSGRIYEATYVHALLDANVGVQVSLGAQPDGEDGFGSIRGSG